MTSSSETSMSQFSPDLSASPRLGGPTSRAHSISSDRPSTTTSVMSTPLAVSPEAAFIAASAASQIVTNDHDSHADTWYDQHGFQPSGETVEVSGGALRHLNSFLDHLLFNFLAVSGTTALSNLRPAVSQVLKPKLAKDAINNADEELREYLGGGDDEEFFQSPTSLSPRDWDLELVWKRTRLRCMVYSSLGDMEEEDEDHHMEEGLLGDEDDASNVSPAVAIFLTSILEYLGEQALISAGQASWNRMRVRYEKEPKDASKSRSDIVDRLIVEDFDMERVALDRTLGRLWRSWKKRVRSGPGSPDLATRSGSTEKMFHGRLGSLAGHDDNLPTAVEEPVNEPEAISQEGPDDDERAAGVPLPMGDRDIDEIEVPGLVHYSDEEADEEIEDALPLSTRPKSMMVFSFAPNGGLPSPAMSQPTTPTRSSRKRANSVPTPAASPYAKREKLGSETPDDLEAEQPTDVITTEDSPEQEEDKTLVSDEAAVPTAEDDLEDKSTKMSHRLSSPLAGAAAAAVAAATAAVASVLATSKKTSPTQEEDDIDTDFEEIEEAQIMTSSRISVGGSISGRSDSPANSDRGSRAPLTITTMPTLVRSGSLRLVDVSSPRTPSTRSQRSSLNQEQSNSSSYSRSVSRSSSSHTQQYTEDSAQNDDARAQKIAGTSALGKSRSNITSPISEKDETPASAYETPFEAGQWSEEPQYFPPVDASARSDGEPVYQERTSSRAKPSQPMFGSTKRHSPTTSRTTPKIDLKQAKDVAGSKVAFISSPPDSATYVGEDEVGPLPTRHTKPSPRQYGGQSTSPTSPTLPEKSRHRHGQPQSPGSPPASIGVVSVDRSANGEALRPSVGRPQLLNSASSSASSNKVRPARVSQDSIVARSDEAAKDFDDLIKSNETIQYTLTPENMREIEGSPRSLTGKATRDRSGSAHSKHMVHEIRRSASVTRATGLRSHPVDYVVEDKGRPPVSMGSRRGPPPQARDARLPRESILEFADFIRATGPPGAEAAPVQANMALRRNQSMRAPGPTVPPRHVSKTSLGGPAVGGGSVSRARLQARDATVDNGNETSDLIDFIRQGPSSSGGNRVPRTLAPFRTTMESDQMPSAVGGRSQDASLPDVPETRASHASKASTNITEMSAPSIQSSVNSQSALLGRQQVSAQANSTWDDSDAMPVRKQRRVRDPYALDFSDEEEEEEDDFDYQPIQTKRKPPPKEESLMDFLNSVAPPSAPDPVPFALPQTQTAPVKTSAPKKKGSTPSLMSRFRQNSNSTPPPMPSSYGSTTRGTAPISQPAGRASNAKPASSASKGYIPIQVNIPTGGDLFPHGYGGTGASSPATTITQAPSRTTGRVPMKKFEPRDAVSTASRGTSDLAEFLKNSEPPPSMATASWSRDDDVPSAGGSRLFGRRKKSAGVA